MTRMGQMVNFPLPDDQWEDSGEGGLFVIMVVPRPEGWSHDYCHIDVVADIRLNRADCNVSAAARDLWEPWEFRKNDCDKQDKAVDFLKDAGEDELAHWALQARNWDDFSVSMLAALHVGSTCHALLNRRTRRGWEARPEDLTEQGQAIRATMTTAFGIRPTLLTFLDT